MATIDDALKALDEAFAKLRETAKIPGVAWGVVRDGSLVHTGGAGTFRDGESTVPDQRTVFRIASMTKSFTAATILRLRDEGRLRLDDEVATHVPELTEWRHPATDAPAITIRHLLTMSAGLPTDDPWGDRQQALPLDAFAELLRAGPTFGWPPGTQFDYSNLGYGILGRVVSAAAGAEYRDVVRDRFLGPLGMASSGYEEDEVPGERLAHGYVLRDGALVREGTDRYGALASMGGLYSTVEDLARWVGFQLDAFPARSDADTLPLRRSSRREMQQVQRMLQAERDPSPAHEVPPEEAFGYGFGLFITSKADIGQVVGHGGGYPGYGTMMIWHPSSGLGVVAAGNLRYAPVHELADRQLVQLVKAPDVPRRPPRPLPAVEAHRATVMGLLERWDDTVADAAFAMNMDLDEPRESRRAAVRKAIDQVGAPLRLDADREERSDSTAHRRWWLRGERGWLEVALLVSPEPEPRIQGLRVTAVLDPSPVLVEAAARLLAAASAGAWPDGLEAAEGVGRGAVLRGLRVVAAWLGDGPATLGRPTAGDGTTTATWELGDSPGAGTLKLTVDPADGRLTAVEVNAPARGPVLEGW